MSGKQSVNGKTDQDQDIGTLRRNMNVPDRLSMTDKAVKKLARSPSVLLKNEGALNLARKLAAFSSKAAHREGLKKKEISSKDTPEELLKILEVQIRTAPAQFIEELINGNGVHSLISYNNALIEGTAWTKTDDIQKTISIISMLLVSKIGGTVVEDTNSFIGLIKSIEKATLRSKKVIFKTLSFLCKHQEVRNEIEEAIGQKDVEPLLRFKDLIESATNLNGDPLLQKEIIDFLKELVFESPTVLRKFELKTHLKILGFDKELQNLLDNSDSDDLKASIRGYFEMTRRLERRLRE